ncbi:hypothetical protein [Aromatoleum anaerobium]|uniref:hypothetical protein n=1 Tax=Aromatoleum anaerobium TaxID=182180 RepID=UPI001B7CE913|nr:hypothetical protein [Aromatoleum anaerobium]MCK0506883.1 hypothetical protein [Aromatoleum anaerobium]
MSDPACIVQICLHLNLGQRVRFVDWKAPGVALQLRSATVVAMKDTQITVQDDATRATWTLPYAAIEIPAGSPSAERHGRRFAPHSAAGPIELSTARFVRYSDR